MYLKCCPKHVWRPLHDVSQSGHMKKSLVVLPAQLTGPLDTPRPQHMIFLRSPNILPQPLPKKLLPNHAISRPCLSKTCKHSKGVLALRHIPTSPVTPKDKRMFFHFSAPIISVHCGYGNAANDQSVGFDKYELEVGREAGAKTPSLYIECFRILP